MNWNPRKFLFLGILSAFLVFSAGSALAQTATHDTQVLRIGGNAIVAENQVVEQAVAVGGNVTVQTGGHVTDQAVAIGGDITLEPESRVDGQVVAIAGRILRQEGAVVGGQEVELFANFQGVLNRFGLFGTVYLSNVLLMILGLLVTAIFGIFLLLLLPGHLQSIAATISQHPFKSAIWGLGGLITATLIVTLLAGSILGALLIPITHLLVLIAGLIGCTATGLWIGQKAITRPRSALFSQFLVGILILAVISLIPIVGGLIVLMVNLFGFGAAILSRFGVLQPSHIQKTFDQLEGTTPIESN